METDQPAQTIDDLMDAGTGLVIEVSRLDAALAKRLGEHLFAWRSLACRGFGVSEDGLDVLRRHFDRRGE